MIAASAAVLESVEGVTDVSVSGVDVLPGDALPAIAVAAGRVNREGWQSGSQIRVAPLETRLPGASLGNNENNRGADFEHAIQTAYQKVVTWRRNLFNVPFGASGKDFVDELARLIQAFADGSTQRGIAWKAVCVACHLLLQKPNDLGSNASHAQHLQRRLLLWTSRKVSELMDEALLLQDHLPRRKTTRAERTSQEPSDTVFSKLVFEGKIRSALRYISEPSSGVLGMDSRPLPGSSKTVREILLDKHPEAKSPPQHALLVDEPLPVNPILFDQLTPHLIKDIGRHSSGSAGPSGLDSDAWKRMLTCFKRSSDRLCAALAAAARCLCTEDISGQDLSAFTAARLIPLDKKPGVRPIAVGEVFRRIICKSIMRVIESDVLRATAPLQVCVGVPSACEAAVHAMDNLFRRPSVEGVLLVDASNAFNALNRSAALHNVPRTCPPMAKIFANTYNSPCRLFVSGGGEIKSHEGTCQGDPLAMAIYAVAITPMIRHLGKTCPTTTQCWYADDDGAADDLVALRQYWDELNKVGPGYGYFPNAVKTILLVKQEHSERALQLFSDTGVIIRSDGCRYLGGALGQQDFCRAYMESMAEKWHADLATLARIAETQPHAAYTAFTKGLSSRWTYHIRSTECPPETFNALDDLINTALLPALTGRDFAKGQPERNLLALPARLGGMAIPILGDMAGIAHQTSRRITEPVVNIIAPEHARELIARVDEVGGMSPALQAVADSRSRTCEQRSLRNKSLACAAASLKEQLSRRQQYLTSIAKEKGVSSWLTAQPSAVYGSTLNKSDFRDAVCLRYGFRFDGLPCSCVCGEDMTVDHAMTCPCGGYPIARHNEVRDVIADVMKDVVHDVQVEPTLLPYDSEDLHGKTSNRSTEARADIKARGFWTRQQEAFFDIRVTHPKDSLLSSSEVFRQLSNNEREKKRQYAQRINTVDRGVFTPLVFTTDGISGQECTRFLKMLVAIILEKNVDLNYSVVMSRLRTKISFCLLRWSITCLRGCRSSYQRRHGKSFVSECHLSGRIY